ncbi:MAG: DUF2304 domain-containing protein [Phycisphaerales bacterium]|nr:MAG: DUF2304 domain-containing protein [Phycisphaerales bacterium]
MNLFQTLALIAIAALFVLTLVAAVRGWATRRDALLWALLWLVAGVAIMWPGVTKVIANALGIGRGADLVLYCAVVVMMLGFLMVYVRLRRIRREMTLLVRELAMRDAVSEGKPPSDEATEPRSDVGAGSAVEAKQGSRRTSGGT